MLGADRYERSEDKLGYCNGNRPLQASGYAYVFLDATYLDGRLGLGKQVCSGAAVIAMGVNADGRSEQLGLQAGPIESRHKAAGAAMLMPVLSGLLPSVGPAFCQC